MKGKIKHDGLFFIMRGGEWRAQRCRNRMFCGDWCPLFGEPKELNLRFKTCSLTICDQRTIIFDEFEDERGKS